MSSPSDDQQLNGEVSNRTNKLNNNNNNNNNNNLNTTIEASVRSAVSDRDTSAYYGEEHEWVDFGDDAASVVGGGQNQQGEIPLIAPNATADTADVQRTVPDSTGGDAGSTENHLGKPMTGATPLRSNKLKKTALAHARQKVQKEKQYKVKDEAYWKERAIRPAFERSGAAFVFLETSTLVLAGLWMGWQSGVAVAGTSSYLLAVMFIGIGLFALVFSLSEMASAFPFSGGSYGFARALVGREAGQLVGISESLLFALVALQASLYFAWNCTFIFQTDPSIEWVWILFLYVYCVSLNCVGGRVIFGILLLDALLVFFGTFIYLFGMMKFGSFTENAGTKGGATDDNGNLINSWYANGLAGFVQALPAVLFQMLGVETGPLMCDDVAEPRKNVPKGLISSAFATVFLQLFFYLGCLSCPEVVPGNFQLNPYLLSDGISFISPSNSNPTQTAAILATILVMHGTFDLCFAWGRQIFAMARSGHLPHFLSFTYRGVPVAACFGGAIASMTGAYIVRYLDPATQVIALAVLGNLIAMTACFNYMCQAVCFIILRTKYSAIRRPFTSPFGLAGAVLCFCIFAACILGMFIYSVYVWQSVVVLLCIYSCAMIYYFLYARYNLLMSPEEYRSLFVLYSIQFVRAKQALAIKGGSKIPVNLKGQMALEATVATHLAASTAAAQAVSPQGKGSINRPVSGKKLGAATSGVLAPAGEQERVELSSPTQEQRGNSKVHNSKVHPTSPFSDSRQQAWH